ncbi:MAG: hypothetical protein AB1679_26270 [Actinomycetota bacterium]
MQSRQDAAGLVAIDPEFAGDGRSCPTSVLAAQKQKRFDIGGAGEVPLDQLLNRCR